jgi:serpin B
MGKKFSTFGTIITLLIVVIVIAAAALLLYQYKPKQLPEADDTGWTEPEVQKVVNANNQFAFDLYSELTKSEAGNIFYSPYSISAALGMTCEGAKGETAEEMQKVFHFPESSVLRPNFAKIYNDINKGHGDYELKTGNALWIQQNYPLLEDYIERVKKYYGGKAANLDFVSEPEKSRQTINSFIEKQTNGKIKDLIPPDCLNPLTRLVLTNAIYFKGIWVWQFDPGDTREMDFRITPTEVVKVPMMYMEPDKARFNYADLGDLQILELPYRGDKISMLIVLPAENLESIEPLTLEKLSEWKSQMQETKLDAIYLPKFEFDMKYFMKDTLSAMGMPTAFSSKADFSGMAGNRDLFISFVIHQAWVKVDEKGTEAAGATAVGMELTAVMPGDIFRADHPFLFIIQQKDTGNILFLGRVNDPAE